MDVNENHRLAPNLRENERLENQNHSAQIQRAADQRHGREEEKHKGAGRTGTESRDKVTTKMHTGESTRKTESGCEEESELQPRDQRTRAKSTPNQI
jgi:hypothetical protein